MKITFEDVKFHVVGMAKFFTMYTMFTIATVAIFLAGIYVGPTVYAAIGNWVWAIYFVLFGIFTYVLFAPRRTYE